MAKDKYGADNIEYGKTFARDPKFNDILSNNSIEDKVKISQAHKNINSLAGVLEKSQRDAHKQLKSISGSLSSTAKQQEKIVKQIRMKELSSSKEIKVVEKSVQQILGKLGYSIDILGKSSKKILTDTARTTKQTLSEYGAALSSDFNINKTNFLAMSLAKASPIFGYFVGKFMETSIFKNFSNLIKEKMGMAVTFVANKMKDLWGRGKERTKDWWSKRKESKTKGKELPKLASGGIVQKEGAAYIHAAEVVAPLDKLQSIIELAMKPTVDKLDSLIRILKFSAIVSVAKTTYKWFKRSKYSSFLSKNKDPQVKLSEDFNTFFTFSMDKYDDMIEAIKGKANDSSKSSGSKVDKIKARLSDLKLKENSEKVKKGTLIYYKKAIVAIKEEKQSRNVQEKVLTKIKKATEGTESRLGITQTFLKGKISSIGTILLIVFGFLKDKIGKLLSLVGKAVKFLVKLPFKAIGAIGNFLIKRFPAIAGALSIMDMGKDAIVGATKAREWHGVKEGESVSASQRVSAGIGSALGGTSSGIEGAKSGALKGAGIGMMIGASAGGPFGAVLGGALGAIAGGLLGAVGGKNISIAVQSVWDSIKSIVSGAWKLIKLPFKIIDALGTRAKNYLNEKTKNFSDYFNKKLDGFIDPIFKVVDPIVSFLTDNIMWLVQSIKKVFNWTMHPLDGLKELMGGLGNKSTNVVNTAKNVANEDIKERKISIDSIESGAMKWARGYESGGVVPKAPNGGIDGRGGQLALVHEGEQIITKRAVESAKLSGKPPAGVAMGSARPDMLSSLIEGLKEAVGNPVNDLFGKLKVGYERVKESLGPSSGFGWLSRMFESAGAGPSAIGWDSTGGSSYGYYQMAEKRGVPQQFLKSFPKIAEKFAGMNVGSQSFNEKWKQLASTDPSFGQSQHDFIKQKYLNPYLDKIKNSTGLDLSLKNPVVKEAVLSTAVQYGPNSNVIPSALKGMTQTASDEDIIRKIGEYKYSNVSSNFRSSTPEIQQAVANRIRKETSIALGALGTGQGVNPQSLPKAKTGGIITGDGPIYAHAGEIIGPIKDVKDSIISALLNKKDVAGIQTNKDFATANLINESNKGFKNAALDSMNNNGKQAAIIVTSLTNSVSTSINNLSKSIASSGGQGNNGGNNKDVDAVLHGNVS